MEIHPIGERVLLTPLEQQERTKGGIYIPDTAKESKKEGIIVAVGTTKEGNPLPLEKGCKVLYGGYSSETIELDGNKFVIVEFKDILATFK